MILYARATDQHLHNIYVPAQGLRISSILFASEMEVDVVFCLSSDRLSPLEVYMKERNIWTLNYRTHRLCVYVNNDTKLKYLLNKRVGELISSAKQSNHLILACGLPFLGRRIRLSIVAWSFLYAPTLGKSRKTPNKHKSNKRLLFYERGEAMDNFPTAHSIFCK